MKVRREGGIGRVNEEHSRVVQLRKWGCATRWPVYCPTIPHAVLGYSAHKHTVRMYCVIGLFRSLQSWVLSTSTTSSQTCTQSSLV